MRTCSKTTRQSVSSIYRVHSEIYPLGCGVGGLFSFCRFVRCQSFCLSAFCGKQALQFQGFFPLSCWLYVRYRPAQQVSQRDAPPVGGFGVWFFIKVRRLRLSLQRRRAPYHNVRLPGVKVSGFGLPPPALVAAGSFLVWFGLPLQSCNLVLAVALFGLCFGLLRWLLCLASLAGLAVGFRCSLKLGFRFGLAGSGVYLNL